MHEIGLLRQLVRTVTSFAEENDVHTHYPRSCRM